MSRKSSRPQILDATRELIEERGGAPVTLTEVANRAGLSRQGVYLHFDDLADLLVELTREVDAGTRTPEMQSTIDQASTGREALRRAVAVQARIKPRIHALVTALDVLRRSDEAAALAFEERDEARYQRVLAVIRRLADERELRPEWDVEEAARLAWAMMSQRVWEDLTMTEDGYTERVGRLLELALCRPAPTAH